MSMQNGMETIKLVELYLSPHSGSVQACNGTALPLPFSFINSVVSKLFDIASNDMVIGTHFVDLGVAGKTALSGMGQC
jgi:hypothetical protein